MAIIKSFKADVSRVSLRASSSRSDVGLTLETRALKLFTVATEFTLLTQLIILYYPNILAVWSSIKTNGKTTGIMHEYVALMHIVPPSVSFTKPKKLIRVGIRFIEWLTTS